MVALTPAAAQAKRAVLLESAGKAHTVKGPLKVLAVPRGKPIRMFFFVDGRRKYVSRSAPYRLNGAGGLLDPSTLSRGRHRVTVRAYFAKERTARATTIIRVRKHRAPGATRAAGQAPLIVSTITKLPGAEVAPAPVAVATNRPPASWDGSADKYTLGARDPGHSGAWLFQEVGGGSQINVINSPVLPGHKAFEFIVNGGERAELAAGGNPGDFHEGDEWWFGDVLYVPSIPNQVVGWDTTSAHTIMQLKNDGTGSPPWGLDLTNRWPDKGFQLFSGSSDRGEQKVVVPGSRIYDRAIPIEIRVKFSSNTSIGNYEVWVDGKLVVPTFNTQTLWAGKASYLKQGQYGKGRGNVIYWHGMKRGTSRAAVTR